MGDKWIATTERPENMEWPGPFSEFTGDRIWEYRKLPRKKRRAQAFSAFWLESLDQEMAQELIDAIDSGEDGRSEEEVADVMLTVMVMRDEDRGQPGEFTVEEINEWINDAHNALMCEIGVRTGMLIRPTKSIFFGGRWTKGPNYAEGAAWASRVLGFAPPIDGEM